MHLSFPIKCTHIVSCIYASWPIGYIVSPLNNTKLTVFRVVWCAYFVRLNLRWCSWFCSFSRRSWLWNNYTTITLRAKRKDMVHVEQQSRFNCPSGKWKMQHQRWPPLILSHTNIRRLAKRTTLSCHGIGLDFVPPYWHNQ